MLTRRFRESLMMAAMVLFAFLAVGCCPVTPLHVTVSLDPSLRSGPDKLDGQIQVDIVAINPNEHQRWRDYSMTQYWRPTDPMRKSVPVFSVILDADKNPSQTLSASDPIWSKWLAGANEKDPPKLYVLAGIRKNWTAADDKPGDQDPRRQILPLGSCRWDKNLGSPPNVKLTVKTTGVITDTQPKRDKPGT
jgi:hypothetical protein